MNQTSHSKIVILTGLFAILAVTGYLMFLMQPAGTDTAVPVRDAVSGPSVQTGVKTPTEKVSIPANNSQASKGTDKPTLTPALLQGESVDDIAAAVSAGANADAAAYDTESADAAAMDDPEFTNYNNAYDETQF